MSSSDSKKQIFVEYYKTKDPLLREKIILEHINLVHKVKSKYRGKGVPDDTLFSVGCIGLIHAVDRFDPNQGAAFSTYAHSLIAGEIKHHFRDKTWSVSVPRSLKEDHAKVFKAVNDLTTELGSSPQISQIATKVELTEERVLEALEIGKDYKSLSLDAPKASGDQSITLGDQMSSQEIKEDFLESLDLKEVILELPKREQLIITLTYMHDMSQQQIAERLGLSQNHVSRLAKQALEKLKDLYKPIS